METRIHTRGRGLTAVLIVVACLALIAAGVYFLRGGTGGEVTLAESREHLETLKAAVDGDTLTNEQVEAIADDMERAVASLREDTDTENGGSLTDDDVVRISDLTMILRTQEKVLESDETKFAAEERIVTLTDSVNELRDERIEQYVADTNGEQVRDFVANRIDHISKLIENGWLTTNRLAITQGYLEDTAEALGDGDLVTAVDKVTRAEELIESDRALQDFGVRG